jgi:hypothetical protein
MGRIEPFRRIRKLTVIFPTRDYPLVIMLVKFDSEAGSFTMNGDIAVQLLKAMGHSGTVPSAILAKDIPAALARLKATVAATPAPAESSESEEKDQVEVRVSLRQRAYPLIDLLTRAAEKGAEVMWK